MSKRKFKIIIITLICLLIIVAYIDRFIMVNGPSTSSIVFRPFQSGINTHKVYGEGLYFISPWNTVYKFNTREQVVEDSLNIMVRNGVTVSVRVTYRYSPLKDSIPFIFRRYGIHYDHVFIDPEVVSVTNELISQFNPEQIYTLRIDSIRQVAYNIARARLNAGGIYLGGLVLSNIQLPPRVVESIEYKLRQEQLAIAYNYEIEIALKKKQIQVIDAEGTRDAQALINGGLTAGYLQFKQIEALQKVATSNNAKTVIIPQGTNTPFLLNSNQ